MARKFALLIPAILILLAGLVFVGIKMKESASNKDVPSNNDKVTISHTTKGDASNESPLTKRERVERDDQKDFQKLEAEFDQILPAKYPNQLSALCDRTLKPEDTLILGGFKKADGTHEFTMLNVVAVSADGMPLTKNATTQDAGIQYKIITRTVDLSDESAKEMGFDSLISPARTQIQNSLVLSNDDASFNIFMNADSIITPITAIVRPGQVGVMSVGTDEKAYVYSIRVDRVETDNSLRIRTRVESPAGL